MNTEVKLLDLEFQGKSGAIASYLIPHSSGVLLVESGPGSTLPALIAGLAKFGYRSSDVTHVLLTHIHLDHAGAAGWLSQQGAEIWMHPLGAPHMADPGKLIASASRIYGDRMGELWGEFLPVGKDQLHSPGDGEELSIGALRIGAHYTPGHAEHHLVYTLEGTCFTGDVGGVRAQRYEYLQIPMPPPELHFGKWQESIRRLRGLGLRRLAPTHFGFYADADWHLDQVELAIVRTSKWLEEQMLSGMREEALRPRFLSWVEGEMTGAGLDREALREFDLANPLGMSADGMLRYWRKFRADAVV